MARFERRPLDENQWNMEVHGVDFRSQFYEYMGTVAADGAEVFTAWEIGRAHV